MSATRWRWSSPRPTQQAKDAAEVLEVDYAELPAVVDVGDAHDAGARRCTTRSPNNSATTGRSATRRRPTPRSPGARMSTSSTGQQPARAERDGAARRGRRLRLGADSFTLYTTSQNPHVIRLLMRRSSAGIPEHKLRVVAPDVGGGFGSKIFHYAEEGVVTWAVEQGRRRPVKWTADRSEAFLTDAHGRDHVSHAELALDADGNFLAPAGQHAWPTWAPTCRPSRSSIPTYLYATLLAGHYKTPAIYCEVKALLHQHRAGRRLSRRRAARGDLPARDAWSTRRRTRSGMDPAEIRRRNFIPNDAFPYQTPVALQYDSGDYEATLDEALKLADWAGFPARKAESERARQAARHRHLRLHRGLRHRALGRGRLARRPRRPVRERQGARAPDRQA